MSNQNSRVSRGSGLFAISSFNPTLTFGCCVDPYSMHVVNTAIINGDMNKSSLETEIAQFSNAIMENRDAATLYIPMDEKTAIYSSIFGVDSHSCHLARYTSDVPADSVCGFSQASDALLKISQRKGSAIVMLHFLIDSTFSPNENTPNFPVSSRCREDNLQLIGFQKSVRKHSDIMLEEFQSNKRKADFDANLDENSLMHMSYNDFQTIIQRGLLLRTSFIRVVDTSEFNSVVGTFYQIRNSNAEHNNEKLFLQEQKSTSQILGTTTFPLSSPSSNLVIVDCPSSPSFTSNHQPILDDNNDVTEVMFKLKDGLLTSSAPFKSINNNNNSSSNNLYQNTNVNPPSVTSFGYSCQTISSNKNNIGGSGGANVEMQNSNNNNQTNCNNTILMSPCSTTSAACYPPHSNSNIIHNGNNNNDTNSAIARGIASAASSNSLLNGGEQTLLVNSGSFIMPSGRVNSDNKNSNISNHNNFMSNNNNNNGNVINSYNANSPSLNNPISGSQTALNLQKVTPQQTASAMDSFILDMNNNNGLNLDIIQGSHGIFTNHHSLSGVNNHALKMDQHQQLQYQQSQVQNQNMNSNNNKNTGNISYDININNTINNGSYHQNPSAANGISLFSKNNPPNINSDKCAMSNKNKSSNNNNATSNIMNAPTMPAPISSIVPTLSALSDAWPANVSIKNADEHLKRHLCIVVYGVPPEWTHAILRTIIEHILQQQLQSNIIPLVCDPTSNNRVVHAPSNTTPISQVWKAVGQTFATVGCSHREFALRLLSLRKVEVPPSVALSFDWWRPKNDPLNVMSTSFANGKASQGGVGGGGGGIVGNGFGLGTITMVLDLSSLPNNQINNFSSSVNNLLNSTVVTSANNTLLTNRIYDDDSNSNNSSLQSMQMNNNNNNVNHNYVGGGQQMFNNSYIPINNSHVMLDSMENNNNNNNNTHVNNTMNHAIGKFRVNAIQDETMSFQKQLQQQHISSSSMMNAQNNNTINSAMMSNFSQGVDSAGLSHKNMIHHYASNHNTNLISKNAGNNNYLSDITVKKHNNNLNGDLRSSLNIINNNNNINNNSIMSMSINNNVNNNLVSAGLMSQQQQSTQRQYQHNQHHPQVGIHPSSHSFANNANTAVKYPPGVAPYSIMH